MKVRDLLPLLLKAIHHLGLITSSLGKLRMKRSTESSTTKTRQHHYPAHLLTDLLTAPEAAAVVTATEVMIRTTCETMAPHLLLDLRPTIPAAMTVPVHPTEMAVFPSRREILRQVRKQTKPTSSRRSYPPETPATSRSQMRHEDTNTTVPGRWTYTRQYWALRRRSHAMVGQS